MKKLRFVPIVALLLCLLSVTALAAETTTPLEPTAPGGKTYTVTYDAGTAGANKQYVILILKSGATPANLTVDSILYIDQAAADATGKVEFKNFQMMRNTSAEVYIGGETLASPAHPHTITVRGVPVTGNVTLDGRTAGKRDGVHAVLTDKTTNVIVGEANTSVAGAYAFDSIPDGTYILKLSRTSYLSHTKQTVTINQETVIPPTNLAGGEIVVDGQITIKDLTALLGQYQAATAEAVDINGDGQVTISDLTILLGNYQASQTTE